MGQKVLHTGRVDVRLGAALAFREVRKKAPGPVDVAAFGAVGVMAAAEPATHVVHRDQRVHSAARIDRRAAGLAAPVRALQKVHEVQPQGVVGLAYLPLFAPLVAFERFAEVAHLIRVGSSVAARFKNVRTQRTQ